MSSEGFVFPSPQWAEAYCKALNENQEYKEAAKDWIWDVVFVATNIPDTVISTLFQLMGITGVSTTAIAMKFKLRNGTCQGSEFYIDASKSDAEYILEADYLLWKDLIQGKVDPVGAILSKKIRIKKGSFLTLVQFSSAAIKMTNTAMKVPTKFIV
ncbi:MAG: Fis family transcriptional regulator [Vulcanisaeta sp. AZ3]|jgi:putative sterol carrier protein|nr:MAG: Fis family transcriptional regulator [Vulcanisaeta sp. AZ3]